MAQTNDYREIEVKLYVKNLDVVRARLEAAGAKLLSARVHEQNLRYDHTDGDFADKGLVLRLRRDNGVRITYKEPQDPTAKDRGIHSRVEVEVGVMEDDFDAADTLLHKLGYDVMMIYEKYRTTYDLAGAEVVLDEMPYGSFVEVEGTSEEAIEQVLDHLGLTNALRLSDSYAQLFRHVKANLGITGRDLTFEAFEGVDVPFSAFSPPENEKDDA